MVIWLTISAVQPTFWDSDMFNVKCHGRQLAPNRCNLGGASVCDAVVQPGPRWLAVHVHRVMSVIAIIKEPEQGEEQTYIDS